MTTSSKELCVARAAISLSSLLLEAAAAERSQTPRTDEVLGMPFLAERRDAAGADRLAAARTERACHLVIVHLAVRGALMFEEGAAAKALLARLAHKVLWMPLLPQRVDAFPLDRLPASCALSRKRPIEAFLTVRFSVTLVEALIEWLEALVTDKVLGMPFLAECGDAPVCNRLVAMTAPRAE